MSQGKRHIPERTCVACGRKLPKWELVRIVRTVEGNVEIDLGGKKSGRGVYLCRSKRCWETALRRDRKNRLAWALKTEIPPEVRAYLLEYSGELPPKEERN